jgi:lysyl-tRNA synthetase class 2
MADRPAQPELPAAGCGDSLDDEATDRAWFDAEGGRRRTLLLARGTLLRAVRGFFEARGYLEVETPLLVQNPGLDLHLDPFPVGSVEAPLGYLATSPELQMKRLVAAGFHRVFQITRSFRQGEHGPRHQPEFTLLEWYTAGAGLDGLIADTEALVTTVAQAVHGSLRVPGGAGNAATIDLTPPWPRMTMRDAFRRFADRSMDETLRDSDEAFFRALVDQVEPGLEATGRGVFLTHWPASMASLARLEPTDPTVARRVEAYAGGLELSNGFDELADPEEQRRRFQSELDARRRSGRATPPIDGRFLRALRAGLPPSTGNALGVDRLLMLCTGARAIDDVVAVPWSRR